MKPLALMRWLVRLVTPPGGTVLEPFAGTSPSVAIRVERCGINGPTTVTNQEGDPE